MRGGWRVPLIILENRVEELLVFYYWYGAGQNFLFKRVLNLAKKNIDDDSGSIQRGERGTLRPLESGCLSAWQTSHAC